MEKAYSNDERWLKLIAALAFIFLTIALILINKNSPATGYEISIYTALPLGVWISLVLSVSCGMWIILQHVSGNRKGNFWQLGFFILIIANFIVLSLQYFRDYYLYGLTDPIGHLQFTTLIAEKGIIAEGNFYPITHLIGAILYEITQISLENVMKFIPVIFSILFILFIYLLADITLPKKEHSLLAAAASTSFLFSYYHLSTYPHALALLSFPFVIYLYFKAHISATVPKKIAFILVLFFFPFFHPLPEIVLIGSLVIGELGKAAINEAKLANERFSMNIPLLSVIPFFLWISYFAVFGTSVQRISRWVTGEVAFVARLNELQPVFGLGPWGFFKLLIKMYGHNLIFIALSLFAIFMITRNIIQKKKEYRHAFILSLMLITSSVLFVLIAQSLGLVTWGRLLGANVGMWPAPIFAAVTLYEISKRFKTPKAKNVFLIGILLSSWVIGLAGLYRSPWIAQVNWQVTHMEISGFNWFNEHQTRDYYLSPMGFAPGSYPSGQVVNLPDHFGYDNNAIIGEIVDKKTYIMLTEKFKAAASETSLQNWINMPGYIARTGFSSADFHSLKVDRSVSKIYSDKEFEVFLAYPVE